MIYAVFEDFALFLVLVTSALYAMKVLAPDLWREWKRRALIAALQPSRPDFIKRIARRYAPAPTVRVPIGTCKTACTGCGKAAR